MLKKEYVKSSFQLISPPVRLSRSPWRQFLQDQGKCGLPLTSTKELKQSLVTASSGCCAGEQHSQRTMQWTATRAVLLHNNHFASTNGYIPKPGLACYRKPGSTSTVCSRTSSSQRTSNHGGRSGPVGSHKVLPLVMV